MVAFVIILIFIFSFSQAVAETRKEIESSLSTYILCVKKPESGVSTQSVDTDSKYQSLLPVLISNQQQRMVYSYRNMFTGFAAKLTTKEAKAIETNEGFVSAHVEKILPLNTTHRTNFLGLQQNLGLWRQSNYGKGVIIGVLTREYHALSFNDIGMSPPPAKWKGKCEFVGRACNNKLIGARNFQSDNKPDPPPNEEGHGTRTGSTTAKNFVQGANEFGQANDTAVGMVPLAHLAMYKVCSEFGCAKSDTLAAMDTAIDNGVDVLSLSLVMFKAR